VDTLDALRAAEDSSLQRVRTAISEPSFLNISNIILIHGLYSYEFLEYSMLPM
jgi:hypothetical protein